MAVGERRILFLKVVSFASSVHRENIPIQFPMMDARVVEIVTLERCHLLHAILIMAITTIL